MAMVPEAPLPAASALDRVRVLAAQVKPQEDGPSDELVSQHRNGTGVLWNGPKSHVKKAIDIFLKEGITDFPVVNIARETELGLTSMKEVLVRCEAEGPPQRPTAPWGMRNVLLTGSTGFLGIHYLARMLRQFPQVHVNCLVRGRSPAQCLERVRTAARNFDLEEQIGVDWERVAAWPGDVTQPQLGLDEAVYSQLLMNIQTVIHFAARDNFFLPFTQLHPNHVGAALKMVDFCARGVVKSMIYSSSCKARLVGVIDPNNAGGMYNGYAQTKYVTHRMLEQLPRLGHGMQCLPPVRLVNMGYVYPDASPPLVPDITDAFEVVFKVMLNANVVPDIESPIDFAPLSYVIGCLLEIWEKDHASRWGEGPGEASGPACLDVFMPRGLQFGDVKAAIQEMRGSKAIKVVPMTTFAEIWRSELTAAGSTHARFMRTLLTKDFELHLNTTFEERDGYYQSAKYGIPKPMSRAALQELLHTIDTKMTLD